MDKNILLQDKRQRKLPQLHPLQQGNLDGLCGIYSIINAVRYLCKEIKREESFALFHFLIKKANKHGNIRKIIMHGLTPKEFKHLLKSTKKWLKCEHGIQIKVTKFKAKKLTLKSAWRDFEMLIEENAIILIGFTGKQNHYSVITAITAKTLTTFDSSKIQLIRKSQCAVKYDEELYCIDKKEVFLLKRKA